jgi:2-polyprenyl-3-methyl-5-hydroxy-6-metoxy-1,4-benzoquinol methylase
LALLEGTLLDGHYVGTELELFSNARNWKQYWRSQIGPYLGHTVLDVGAGAGATAELCCDAGHVRWVALEPDGAMVSEIERKVRAGTIAPACEARRGTLASLNAREKFDSVIYIDVLEHIEHDADELRRAFARVRPGGHLIVLSPAHQALFTDFDRSIGHFRRYSLKTLQSAAPAGAKPVHLRYLDSVGVAASLANRLLLKQSMPTKAQILTWDRLMVPVSRLIDPVLMYRFGKSVLGIWHKAAA